MHVAVIGRGNVGGGLAERWRRVGHDVTELGREGGDVSGADAVLVAVPGGRIGEALSNVRGHEGKVVVDATNIVGERSGGHESLAHEIKALTGGPVAKSFNTNFAALYDLLDAEETPPGNLYAADDEAREVVEELIRDAGYEPVYVGGLEHARKLEDHLALELAIAGAGLGRFFYRLHAPR
jgi:predicted dinucleotide-binding enzyme